MLKEIIDIIRRSSKRELIADAIGITSIFVGGYALALIGHGLGM